MTIRKELIASLFAGLLAACGGGSESTSAPSTPEPLIPTMLSVTPALGKVTGAVIHVFDLDNHLLAKGTMTDTGQLSVNLPANWHDGVIVEVSGAANAQYYDEGMATMRPLPAGRTLHAISIPFRAELSVTALTEVIYQRAKYLAAAEKITPTLVEQATNETLAAFADGFTDSPLIIPDVISKNTDLPSDSAKGIYAAVLAGWAKHAYSKKLLTKPDCHQHDDCNPLLDMIDDLATDFSDGQIDGKKGSTPISSIFFDATVANATNVLKGQLFTAKELNLTAVRNKVTGVALAHERIGKYFAGSYDLNCFQSGSTTSEDNSATKLTITDDGSMIANGPFGNLLLLAGTGSSGLNTMDNKLLFNSSLTATRAVPSAQGKLTSDGIGHGAIVERYNVGFINTMGDGSGAISKDKQVWGCTGFPIVTAEKTISDIQLSKWLPDGKYTCQYNRQISIQDGVMSLGAEQISLTTPNIMSLREAVGYDFISILTLSGRETPQYLALIGAMAKNSTATGLMQITLSEGATVTTIHDVDSNLQYFSVRDYEQCVNSTSPLSN